MLSMHKVHGKAMFAVLLSIDCEGVLIGHVIGRVLGHDLKRALCDCIVCAFQVSTRNRILILLDWIKTRAFGRDLSVF